MEDGLVERNLGGQEALVQGRLTRAFFARPVLEVAPELLGCTISHAGVTVRLTEVEAYDGANDPGSHAFRGQTPRTRVMFGEPGGLYVYFTYGMHWCANLVCGSVGAASAVLLRAGEVVGGLETARARRVGVTDRDLARGPARLAMTLALTRDQNGLDTTATDSPLVLRALPGRLLGLVEPPGQPDQPEPPDLLDQPDQPEPPDLRDQPDQPDQTDLRDQPDQPDLPVSPERSPGPGRIPMGPEQTVAVCSGPRVGVSGPGGDGAAYPWRFWLDGEETVSVYRRATARPSKPVAGSQDR
jgi:DNA-3-methyladenine glycosylase